MREPLKFSDFQEWKEKTLFLYASGTDRNGKMVQILCSLNNNIIVRRSGETVWQGMQPFAAIEKFNDLIQ